MSTKLYSKNIQKQLQFKIALFDKGIPNKYELQSTYIQYLKYFFQNS